MKLAWGILGTGNIASQFAEGVGGSTGGTLAAVGSRTAESAARFAQAHGIPRAHASYEQLLADPAVQAVYVSLPNSMHHEWTLKALAAGKHVLCEKPFASTLAQARDMYAAAKKHNRLLAEAFMYRSHPLTWAVQKALADGTIGTLKLIRTSFVYASSKIAGNIRFDPALHGGALMDIGCYCLSYSRLFAHAEPTSMHIHGHLHDTGVDDYAAGSLAFPNGILATFSCGMTLHADNTATLHGTHGYLEIPIPWKPPATNAAFTVVTPAGRQTHTVDTGKPLYALEADEFANSVFDGTPLRIPESETLGNQHCLDQLRHQMGLTY
jgi:D-xylose 1-dehydrogenase (NADP+, D-xylono-1,5-lactone-forming)